LKIKEIGPLISSLNSQMNEERKLKYLNRVLIATVPVLLTGCMNITMTPAVNNTDLATVDFKKNYKKGEACAVTILTAGPFGDASVMKAAKNGDIRNVNYVDHKAWQIILIGQRCTIVYGW
jgi:hypothetical protein